MVTDRRLEEMQKNGLTLSSAEVIDTASELAALRVLASLAIAVESDLIEHAPFDSVVERFTVEVGKRRTYERQARK